MKKIGKSDYQPKDEEFEKNFYRIERGKKEIFNFCLVLLLILGIGVVAYALSIESLSGLFNSDYFNNLVRLSFGLLLVTTVIYLLSRDRSYNKDLKNLVSSLNANIDELQRNLGEVKFHLEISRMVAISEDLHERLEARFPGMRKHWKRVAYYATEIARRMGLDEDYVHQIEKAAELMDIGMLKFGDNFRMDSPELGPREREMVRRHPIFSVEILQTVRSNWEILPLVRHHHEWWNGMGYPDGLKGEAIPLGARILCLADAFVAMVSPRAFREALDVKSALKEIEEYSGVQFDPRVARTFLDYMLSRIKGSIFINGDENDYPRAGREIGSSRITGNPAGVDDGKEFGCGIDEATLLDMLREIHVKP